MSTNSHQRFAHQVVLITGASSGIGLAAAKAFAKEGASLMLAARRPDKLNEVAGACRNAGVPCETLATDVQDHAQVVRLVDKTIERFSRIDVLINNAGLGFFGPFQLQPWEDVVKTVRTNFEGALGVCHAVVPQMIKQGSGVIVNVSSVAGKRSVPLLAAYSGTKFGLWGFSQSLRLDLQPHGIHVCHFCPTSTATEFHARAGMEAPGGSAAAMDSADQVAAAMIDAIIKRKREHIMSLTERVLTRAHLVAPGLTDRLLSLVRKPS